jgi:hypothetical protein
LQQGANVNVNIFMPFDSERVDDANLQTFSVPFQFGVRPSLTELFTQQLGMFYIQPYFKSGYGTLLFLLSSLVQSGFSSTDREITSDH